LRGLIADWFLPRTDRAVFIQVGLVMPYLAIRIWFARHDPDRKLFRIGMFVFVGSLFALRTLH